MQSGLRPRRRVPLACQFASGESAMDSDRLLMAYADGEVGQAMAREVEHRIDNDPQARARLELYQKTASLVRSACGEAHYSPRTTRLPPAGARMSWSWRRAALALTASIAVGALGFG